MRKLTILMVDKQGKYLKKNPKEANTARIGNREKARGK